MLLQFGGSLIAILVLTGIAAALKLGGKTSLRGEMDVATAAAEIKDGFDLKRSSITRGGKSALAQDEAGHIIVIKRHGNKFAGRILTSSASAQEAVDALIVDTGEPRFGAVRLSLSDASYWADAINRL